MMIEGKGPLPLRMEGELASAEIGVAGSLPPDSEVIRAGSIWVPN